MSGYQTGLRFDIYERVQLNDSLTGLEQMEEVELVPNIQVLSQEEQAVLKGYLTLTGSYTVSEDRGVQQLEHQIPVEITLPMSRITSLEDLKVDIDHFDIDLISPRSLSVTGVLSLEGIEMVQSSNEKWEEQRELAVHQYMEEQQDQGREENATDASLQRDGKERVEATEEPNDELPANQDAVPISEEPKDEETESLADKEVEEEVSNESEISLTENEESSFENELVNEEEVVSEANEEAAQENPSQQMKIAFGSKPSEENHFEEAESSNGLKSLLHEESKAEAKETETEDFEKQEEHAEASPKRGVQWKSLFLNRTSEEEQFKKLRLCIVQKDDTMDSIAERYSINPKEIMLHNRMNLEELTEGQIIYIPKS